MIDSQFDNGLVPDIAPEYVPFVEGFRDSPEWGSSAVILPWYLYQWYGDKRPMEKAWTMMTRYMERLPTMSDVYDTFIRAIERDGYALTAGDIGFHYLGRGVAYVHQG
jgi:hypothetical protein